jgi:hypothetical protein
VSRAPPDGYTLLISAGSFWLGSLLQNVSYDSLRGLLIDFFDDKVTKHPGSASIAAGKVAQRVDRVGPGPPRRA